MAVKRWNGTGWDIYAGADTSLIKPANITAKGDLIAGTGSGTISRVAVGTDGQLLTASSTSSTGVTWTTVSGYSAPTLGSTTISSGATVTSVTGLTVSGPDFIATGTNSVGSLPRDIAMAMMGAL